MTGKKLIILLSYIGGLFILFFVTSFFHGFDNPLIDTLFKIRYTMNSNEKISPDLVVFQLDDNTIKKHNISDNDRTPFSLMVDALNIGKSNTILFDILFRLPGKTRGDNMLLQSIKEGDNIFFPAIFKQGAKEPSGTGPSPLLDKFIIYPEKNILIPFPVITDAILPYEKFLVSLKGIGGISLSTGPDGIIRKLPMLYSYKDGYLPSIVLAGVCHFLNVPLNSIKILAPGKIFINNINHPFFEESSLSIPLDRNGNLIINFVGPWEASISSYSLAPFISGPLPSSLPSLLENTIVVIADMTTAKKDFSKGIFNPVLPNSAIHSNAINTILTNNFLRPTGFPDSLLLIILIAGEGLLFLIITRKKTHLQRRLIGGGLVLLFILTLFGYDILSFTSFNKLPDVFFHCLVILFTLIYLSKIRPYVHEDTRKENRTTSVSQKVMQPAIAKETVDFEKNKEIEEVLKERFKLTRKEIDTAVILLAGKQYKEISGLLQVSESAVKIRIHKIYNKCGVGNKMEFSNLVRGKLLKFMDT